MDRRTTGIVLTIVAVLLCGLPGLLFACLGVLFAVISAIPGARIDVLGRTDPRAATSFGGVALCLGLVFILIPFVVGILSLRKQPAAPKRPAAPVPPPPAGPVPVPYPSSAPVEPPAAAVITQPEAEPHPTGGAVVYPAAEPLPPTPEEPLDPDKPYKPEDAPDEWIPPAI